MVFRNKKEEAIKNMAVNNYKLKKENPLLGKTTYKVLYSPNVTDDFLDFCSNFVPISGETKEGTIYELETIKKTFYNEDVFNWVKKEVYIDLKEEIESILKNSEIWGYDYIEV